MSVCLFRERKQKDSQSVSMSRLLATKTNILKKETLAVFLCSVWLYYFSVPVNLFLFSFLFFIFYFYLLFFIFLLLTSPKKYIAALDLFFPSYHIINFFLTANIINHYLNFFLNILVPTIYF